MVAGARSAFTYEYVRYYGREKAVYVHEKKRESE